jgi:hypothetical protein
MKTHNQKILLITIFIISILVLIVESRKKKKKSAGTNKTEPSPKERRPTEVSAELFCDACIAIIKEATKELRGKKKESDILDIWDEVCHPEKYNTYRNI